MDGNMAAILKRTVGRGASLESVSIPRIGPRDILVKVSVASICGTDLKIYRWDAWAECRIKPPRVFGHEFAGYVVGVGSHVNKDLKEGDYVSAECHVPCGTCYQCQTGHAHICKNYRILGVDFDGAFAEYVSIPEQCIWKNRPELPPEIASIQDPFGNALHTTLCVEVTGKTVVVNGCGPIGLFAIAIAKAAGALDVIAVDPNRYRLGIARTLGASLCLDPCETSAKDAIFEFTQGAGADFVMEMSGYEEAVVTALRVLKNGGDIALLGVPAGPVSLDMANDIVFKGITLHGITGRKIFDTWYKTSAFLGGIVDIRPVLTHRFAFEDFEEAFSLMESGQCGKVFLYPPGNPVGEARPEAQVQHDMTGEE